MDRRGEAARRGCTDGRPGVGGRSAPTLGGGESAQEGRESGALPRAPLRAAGVAGAAAAGADAHAGHGSAGRVACGHRAGIVINSRPILFNGSMGSDPSSPRSARRRCVRGASVRPRPHAPLASTVYLEPIPPSADVAVQCALAPLASPPQQQQQQQQQRHSRTSSGSGSGEPNAWARRRGGQKEPLHPSHLCLPSAPHAATNSLRQARGKQSCASAGSAALRGAAGEWAFPAALQLHSGVATSCPPLHPLTRFPSRPSRSLSSDPAVPLASHNHSMVDPPSAAATRRFWPSVARAR